MGGEGRVVLLNNLVEKGLLGSVTLVTTSIPVPGGHPGRGSVQNLSHFRFSGGPNLSSCHVGLGGVEVP